MGNKFKIGDVILDSSFLDIEFQDLIETVLIVDEQGFVTNCRRYGWPCAEHYKFLKDAIPEALAIQRNRIGLAENKITELGERKTVASEQILAQERKISLAKERIEKITALGVKFKL